ALAYRVASSSIRQFSSYHTDRYLCIEGSCIHSQRATQSTGNPRQSFQPGESSPQASNHKSIQHQSCSGDHARIFKGQSVEILEMNDDSVKSLVTNQYVGASSQDKLGQSPSLD